MLKTETNTLSMSRRVRAAAFDAQLGRIGELQTDFEHGQWWVTNTRTGAQWSAIDTEGAGAVDGFGFEQVTEGE